MISNIRVNLLTFIIFTVGALAMLTQIINIREFMVIFYGNELVIGIVLAIWLAGISIGALIGSQIVDRMIAPFNFLYPVVIIFVILQPLNITFIRSLRMIFTVDAGQLFPIGTTALAAVICLAPLGCIVGVLFPLIVQICRRDDMEDAVTIGRVYMIEAIGALFGGALFTFLLAQVYNPFHITAFMGTCIILPVGLLALTDRKPSRRWSWGIASSVVLVILIYSLLGSASEELDQMTCARRWNSLQSGTELAVNRDSKYQNIAIGRSGDEYSLYINCSYSGSFPDRYRTAPLAHQTLSSHPEPDNLLVIGNGLPHILRDILKHPVKRLDYATIDPVLVTTVEEFTGKITDDRLHYHYREGRSFVNDVSQTSSDRYDVVLLDVPEPETAMLNRYYTREFFVQVKSILKPGGIVVLSAAASPNYFSDTTSKYAASIYQTLKFVFPYIAFAPGERLIMLASADETILHISPGLLAERYSSRRIRTDYFHTALFEQLLQKERIEFTREQLERAEGFKINTDRRPVAYYLNIILWDSYSGSRLAPVLKYFYKNGPKLVLVLVVCFALGWIIYHTYRGRRGVVSNYLYVMFSTGAWSLSQSLILIFAYQSRYGYIYNDIGLMIGLFMFGLSMGVYLSNRILILKKNIRSLPFLAGSELIILFIIISQMLLIVFGLYSSKIVYLLFILLCGIGTGLQYPFINRVLIEGGMPLGKTAGLVDSMDHLGAFLGALVTNILLVPILGITATLAALLIMKAAGTVSLIFSKR